MATIIALAVIGALCIIIGLCSVAEKGSLELFLIGLGIVIVACLIHDFKPAFVKKGWIQEQAIEQPKH